MAAYQPPCVRIFPWLKSNLGKRCCAGLTGTDVRALRAAVEIIELYSYHRTAAVLKAFDHIVRCMQPSMQELAYHSIAMIMNWEDRDIIWVQCQLPPLSPQVCAFEPGGSRIEFKP